MIKPLQAAKTIIVILTAVFCFHLLVLTGLIPYQVVWGGRLQTRSEMITFEMVSLLLNALMSALAAMRAGWLGTGLKPRFLRVGLWVMAVLFALNTVGNIFSTNRWEQVIFTPLTLVLAFLSIIAARGAGAKTIPAGA